MRRSEHKLVRGQEPEFESLDLGDTPAFHQLVQVCCALEVQDRGFLVCRKVCGASNWFLLGSHIVNISTSFSSRRTTDVQEDDTNDTSFVIDGLPATVALFLGWETVREDGLGVPLGTDWAQIGHVLFFSLSRRFQV